MGYTLRLGDPLTGIKSDGDCLKPGIDWLLRILEIKKR
jgi:hypothetical protein